MCTPTWRAAGAANDSYRSGDYIDASWVVAVTMIAWAPGWRGRPWAVIVRRDWLPLAAPVLDAVAAIGVLVAGNYTLITPVAIGLALATLAAALGRLAMVFREARRAGEHAQLAQTDDLTLLLNRGGFYERAAAILPDEHHDEGSSCALLLLDLDHFKDVNDSLGHAVGDQLLQIVAARLSTPLREQDILVRLGGDEFAVLLPDVNANQALCAASSLSAALDEDVELDGLYVQTGPALALH